MASRKKTATVDEPEGTEPTWERPVVEEGHVHVWVAEPVADDEYRHVCVCGETKSEPPAGPPPIDTVTTTE